MADSGSIGLAKVSNLTLEYGKKTWIGTAHLLAHNFLFIPDDSSGELWLSYSSLRTISRYPSLNAKSWPLHMLCRNLLLFRLTIQKETDAIDLFSSLSKLIHTSSTEDLYAFSVLPSPGSSLNADRSLGWDAFDAQKEYGRMGVGSRTDQWRFTKINEIYEFSPTYPRALVVPAKISDNVLRHTAKFRSKARIPALSYLHWDNLVSISRCSQPMVGLKNNRSAQDEALIKAIFSTGLRTTGQSPNLILDARPMANAMANKAGGAGTEDGDIYKAKIIFCGIENIHALRDSWKYMCDAIMKDGILNGAGALNRHMLDKSGWSKHLRLIVEATLGIVQNVHVHASHVVVHCSDGWDRTAQLVSLSTICLDPFYRTFEGLATLIEKEWCSFGHKFQDRCGHLSSKDLLGGGSPKLAPTNSTESVRAAVKGGVRALKNAAKGDPSSEPHIPIETTSVSYLHSKEVSPIFALFLDGLYNIFRQFPTQFEYSDKLFHYLHHAIYNCKYGNFLYNCERERGSAQVQTKCYSAWNIFASEEGLKPFRNPAYRSTAETVEILEVEGLTRSRSESQDQIGSESSISSSVHDEYIGAGLNILDVKGVGEPGTMSPDGKVLFPRPRERDLVSWFAGTGAAAGGDVGEGSEGEWVGWEGRGSSEYTAIVEKRVLDPPQPRLLPQAPAEGMSQLSLDNVKPAPRTPPQPAAQGSPSVTSTTPPPIPETQPNSNPYSYPPRAPTSSNPLDPAFNPW